jgi:hypothetical protein
MLHCPEEAHQSCNLPGLATEFSLLYRHHSVNLSNTMTKTVSLSPDALFQEVNGELVILDLASEKYFGLNQVGARIWLLLESGKTLAEAQNVLLEEFDVEPGQLSSDINQLLEQLSAEGLVTLNHC